MQRQNIKGGLIKPNPKAVSISLPVIDHDDDYLTDEEVMDWLNVKRQWLADHRTRVEPIVPHIKMGKQILYPKPAVKAWLDALVETRPTWERRNVA